MANKVDALIFDLDGTLVDSAADLRRALNNTLFECGRKPLSLNQVKDMIGDGIAKLVERGFAATGIIPRKPQLAAQVSRFVHHYDQALTVETVLYPGVFKALRSLESDGRLLGVCTNKPYDQSVRILEGLNVDGYFGVVTGGDSTDRRKPDPKPLLKTLEQVGAKPSAALFIGDSANDVETAKRAGVRSVLVSYGYEKADLASLGAARIIESFALIPEVIKELEAAPS